MSETAIKFYTDQESMDIAAGKNPVATSAAPAAEPASPTPTEKKEDTSSPETAPTPAAETIQSPTPGPKEIFGEGYESWEKGQADLTRLRDMESRYKELEEKVKEYTPEDPYVAELNKALRSGITREAFDQYYTSDPEKLTPSQKISLQYQLRDGLTKAEADLMVEQRYKLGDFAPDYDEADARQKQIDEITLKQDSNAADAYIRQRRSELVVSPLEKAIEASVREFEPIVPTIISELTTLGEGEYAYTVPKETTDAVNEHLRGLIGSGIMENMERATPQAIATLKGIASDFVKGREFDNYRKFINTVWEKKTLTEKVNPRPPAGENPPPPGPSKYEQQMQIAKAFNDFG